MYFLSFNQIYLFPEKKVIVVHDIDLVENFLIYIDKVENKYSEWLNRCQNLKKNWPTVSLSNAGNPINSYYFIECLNFEINVMY